jgi:small subunit ribosomal protein S21
MEFPEIGGEWWEPARGPAGHRASSHNLSRGSNSSEVNFRMAIRIKARSGESVERMMRRFKKLCEKEGLTKDIKRRAYYEKPSERKRREQRKNFKRTVRETE